MCSVGTGALVLQVPGHWEGEDSTGLFVVSWLSLPEEQRGFVGVGGQRWEEGIRRWPSFLQGG